MVAQPETQKQPALMDIYRLSESQHQVRVPQTLSVATAQGHQTQGARVRKHAR